MGKKQIILREGEYSCTEICEMCDLNYSTFVNQIARNKKKIEFHCTVEQTGRGKDARFKLTNVPSEPILKKDFGKDPNKRRSDKGMQREDYNTIKEEFKPLIYNVLLSKPNHSFTATLSEWLLEAQLVEEEFLKGRKLLTDGLLEDDFTKEFLGIEGDSLRRCFIGALESMEKSSHKGKKNKGRISWYKKKVVIDMNGSRIELGETQTAEIENIETELFTLFQVTSRMELAYKSRARLKEFDTMYKMILEDRYGYRACYTAYQVIAKVGVKKSTIEKNLKEAKEWYGITPRKAEGKILDSHTNIYNNRKRRAEIRYQKKIDKINKNFNNDSQSCVCDEEFVTFLRELDLTNVGTLEDYMSRWVVHYSVYINSKINI